jgi:nucleoside-diphosphate-sugar epimerase
MGFRPHTVYGPGRDFGLTADPTLAMKSTVLGRPFQIRWGGATDLIHADDVARACIAASTATLEGAGVHNLHGESAKVVDVARLIEEAWPSAKGTITHVEQSIPFPSELADPGYQRDLGPAPRTGLEDGIRKTLDEFAALQKAGRLDARELEPANPDRQIRRSRQGDKSRSSTAPSPFQGEGWGEGA